MLKEVLNVYIPLVDDHAVDAIIKRPRGLRRYRATIGLRAARRLN